MFLPDLQLSTEKSVVLDLDFVKRGRSLVSWQLAARAYKWHRSAYRKCCATKRSDERSTIDKELLLKGRRSTFIVNGSYAA